METSNYISDIMEIRKEVYLGQKIMKETHSTDSSSREDNFPKSTLKEIEPETLIERKEGSESEKVKQVEQNKIWELYKEKSLRSNLWKLFVETFINEHKLLQIHETLESEKESTFMMDLAILWSRFVRTIILPAIGLFFLGERDTISSLYKEGLDPNLIDNKSAEKSE